MLEFEFMRRALTVGFMLSIMLPLIGVVMVNRRTSMIGDALSHTSLAGVGLGLILGFDPTRGAMLVCLLSAFGIEYIRKHFPHYGDMATAVIMSLGLGLAAILSDFAPSGNTFDFYLFGSISAVTRADLYEVAFFFVLVVLVSLVYYGALLDIAISPNLARLSGVPVRWVNFLFTALTAISTALATKIIGALMVTSLMVLPVTTALFISRSYRQTLIYSVLYGILYMMLGLTQSYYFDIRPGGAIVVFAVLGLGLTLLGVKLNSWRKEKSA